MFSRTGAMSWMVFSMMPVLLAWASCGTGEGPNPCDSAFAVQMEVRHGDASVRVDLGSLAGDRRADLCLVPLDQVVEAADLGIVLSETEFDFEGEDGFRPSQVGCAPLDGALLSRGWADMSTGTLVWDESLGLRGCYSVTKARAMLAFDLR